ncbi:hypothetical protein C5167_029798 [Papaver somniferum]|nr:hypothetical protein C5167_029798 [Papaver somniferum]
MEGVRLMELSSLKMVTNMEHSRYSDEEAAEVSMTSIVGKPQNSYGQAVDFMRLCGSKFTYYLLQILIHNINKTYYYKH